jgi:glycosyltransferase involved in cell wall biosynthesis
MRDCPSGARAAIQTMSRDSLRVLHVVAPAPVGGLESVVRLLATGSRRRGLDVRVAAVLSGASTSTHPFINGLQDDGIRTEVIAVDGRGYRAERAALAALLRQWPPHVVHTHGFRPDVVDGGIARRAQIATVSTVHSFIARSWRGRLYEAVQRRVLRHFDAVIAVSRPIFDKLAAAGVPATHLHCLPNAFRSGTTLSRDDARASLGVTGERPVIGWVGRLSAEKGPDVMLDAFARVADRRALLAMIGHGSDLDALRERAQRVGISDRVVWTGQVLAAERLFSAFDVFVLSSRTEGTPMALLEAMAAALPIVATIVGGVPDVLDAACAQLVPALDVVAIAQAIDTFLASPAESRRFGDAARSKAESRFAVDPWLDAYEAIYRSVAARHSRAVMPPHATGHAALEGRV